MSKKIVVNECKACPWRRKNGTTYDLSCALTALSIGWSGIDPDCPLEEDWREPDAVILTGKGSIDVYLEGNQEVIKAYLEEGKDFAGEVR